MPGINVFIYVTGSVRGATGQITQKAYVDRVMTSVRAAMDPLPWTAPAVQSTKFIWMKVKRSILL